ncbi:MAG: hypothetical protein OHK0011_11770 [Turneriella sp.]
MVDFQKEGFVRLDYEGFFIERCHVVPAFAASENLTLSRAAVGTFSVTGVKRMWQVGFSGRYGLEDKDTL